MDMANRTSIILWPEQKTYPGSTSEYFSRRRLYCSTGRSVFLSVNSTESTIFG